MINKLLRKLKRECKDREMLVEAREENSSVFEFTVGNLGCANFWHANSKVYDLVSEFKPYELVAITEKNDGLGVVLFFVRRDQVEDIIHAVNYMMTHYKEEMSEESRIELDFILTSAKYIFESEVVMGTDNPYVQALAQFPEGIAKQYENVENSERLIEDSRKTLAMLERFSSLENTFVG